MDFLSFTALEDMGGSIKLNNITYLALNVDFEYRSDESYMGVLSKFYISLSISCPSLKTLNFVFDDGVIEETSENSDNSQHPRLFDISEGCVDLDWDITNLRKYLEEEFVSSFDPDYTCIDAVFEEFIKIDMEAKKLLKNFDRFLNTTNKDMWHQPGEKTLKYWENIRPTPVLLVACQDHFRWSPCSCHGEHPEVCMGSYEISLRVRKDGTPLHKYTGLRQIFEGEPW